MYTSLSGLALEQAASGCLFSWACCHDPLSQEHSVHAWHTWEYLLSLLVQEWTVGRVVSLFKHTWPWSAWQAG